MSVQATPKSNYTIPILSSVVPGVCQDNTFKQATAASFQILSYLCISSDAILPSAIRITQLNNVFRAIRCSGSHSRFTFVRFERRLVCRKFRLEFIVVLFSPSMKPLETALPFKQTKTAYFQTLPCLLINIPSVLIRCRTTNAVHKEFLNQQKSYKN